MMRTGLGIQVTVVARQYSSTDAFSTVSPSTDIEDNYVDGVSVTHGASGSREHVWSYAVAQSSGSGQHQDCPDDGGVSPPAFARSDWSCASGNPASSGWGSVWYADELFNELGQVTLSAVTTDDVEVRILANQGAADEEVGVTRVYIAVR